MFKTIKASKEDIKAVVNCKNNAVKLCTEIDKLNVIITNSLSNPLLKYEYNQAIIQKSIKLGLLKRVYEPAHATELYNKNSVEYCKLLELLV